MSAALGRRRSAGGGGSVGVVTVAPAPPPAAWGAAPPGAGEAATPGSGSGGVCHPLRLGAGNVAKSKIGDAASLSSVSLLPSCSGTGSLHEGDIKIKSGIVNATNMSQRIV